MKSRIKIALLVVTLQTLTYINLFSFNERHIDTAVWSTRILSCCQVEPTE
jgi:hypothetical protein